MNRKAYIMLLMYVAWPVNLIHRYWNNKAPEYITPFPFEPQELSVQWYVMGLLSIVSWLMIFWAIWLYITGVYRQDRDFKAVFSAYFIILAIDLPHYLLCFKRSEYVMGIEGIIMLYAALITVRRNFKRNNKCGGN